MEMNLHRISLHVLPLSSLHLHGESESRKEEAVARQEASSGITKATTQELEAAVVP
jgi:hypothetical protein